MADNEAVESMSEFPKSMQKHMEKSGARPIGSEQESQEQEQEQTTQEETTSQETTTQDTEDKTTSEDTSQETSDETKENPGEGNTEDNTGEEQTQTTYEEDKTETESAPSTDINSIVKEKTEGQYEDFDSVVSELDQLKTQLSQEKEKNVVDKISEINEQLQTQLEGTGVNDIQDFYSKLNKDYESMDGFSLIEEHMRDEDPEASDTEIQVEMDDFKEVLNVSEEELQEKIDNGELSQKDVNKVKARYDKKLREAKKSLTNKQAKLKEISESSASATQEQSNENQLSPEEARAQVQQDLSGFDKERIKAGESEYEVDLTSDNKKNLENALLDGNFFQSRWFNSDGSANKEQLMSDYNLLVNKEHIFKQVAENAGAERAKQELNNIDNKQYGDKRTTPSPQPKQDVMTARKEAVKNLKNS